MSASVDSMYDNTDIPRFIANGTNEFLLEITGDSVGFEVLTAVSSNMAVFWFAVPRSLVELY
jgi:hypothetical protein